MLFFPQILFSTSITLRKGTRERYRQNTILCFIVLLESQSGKTETNLEETARLKSIKKRGCMKSEKSCIAFSDDLSEMCITCRQGN